jgi:hypothetical protein
MGTEIRAGDRAKPQAPAAGLVTSCAMFAKGRTRPAKRTIVRIGELSGDSGVVVRRSNLSTTT